jgi:hypothetical protein
MWRTRGLTGKSVLVSLAVLGGAAAPLAAQRIDDLGGLGFRDPTRSLGKPAPPPPTEKLVRGQPQPPPPPPPPNRTQAFTPSITNAESLFAFGITATVAPPGLVRNVPLSLAVSEKVVQPKGSSGLNRIQVDLEAHRTFEDRTKITGTVEYYYMTGGTTSEELSLEFGRDVLATPARDVWFGLVVAYDRLSQTTGTSSGLRPGANATVTINGALAISVAYAYDFSSDMDAYSGKIAYRLQRVTMTPTFILGYVKSKTWIVGVQLSPS